jgi:glycosyltransferase involved in cell wall biosynthesis
MQTVTSKPALVSIVIPARNEEKSLPACLESLRDQAGIDFELIVVDDASSDQTVEIARSFRGVQVIAAGPLPPHWTGKTNAMAAGVRLARGKWLLFTDADTVHKPDSLRRAVDEAESLGAALLSYSPEQEVSGFWEKAVMPVVFAELASTYPPNKVNDPTSAVAAANGQYLLISRTAYDAVGGYARVASDLLEDVAMARLVKSSGRKIFFRYGGGAVCTRMYRSWAEMKEGWTKNLALLFRHPVRMAAFYLVESFVLLAALSIGIGFAWLVRAHLPSEIVTARPAPYAWLFDWWTVGAVVLLLAYMLARSACRLLRARFPLRMVAISVLGPPVFAYLLLRSAAQHRNGGVGWKGRTYHVTRTADGG